MAARKPARYLVPLALLAIAATVALLVRGQLGNSSSSPARSSGPTLSHSARDQAHTKPPGRKFYIVKSGDTLTGISIKTHVPVPTLQALNPGSDPNALQRGQRLRLRR